MAGRTDGTVTVVSRIDGTGRVELDVDGTRSERHHQNVEDARSFVGQHAVDLAARLGRDVVLDTADPEGSWLFVARPDGSMVETASPTTRAREPEPFGDGPAASRQTAPPQAPRRAEEAVDHAPAPSTEPAPTASAAPPAPAPPQPHPPQPHPPAEASRARASSGATETT